MLHKVILFWNKLLLTLPYWKAKHIPLVVLFLNLMHASSCDLWILLESLHPHLLKIITAFKPINIYTISVLTLIIEQRALWVFIVALTLFETIKNILDVKRSPASAISEEVVSKVSECCEGERRFFSLTRSNPGVRLALHSKHHFDHRPKRAQLL